MPHGGMTSGTLHLTPFHAVKYAQKDMYLNVADQPYRVVTVRRDGVSSYIYNSKPCSKQTKISARSITPSIPASVNTIRALYIMPPILRTNCSGGTKLNKAVIAQGKAK